MKDERIGKKMIHPYLGEITIKDIRKFDGYTIAYFGESFVNYDILKEIKGEKNEKGV